MRVLIKMHCGPWSIRFTLEHGRHGLGAWAEAFDATGHIVSDGCVAAEAAGLSTGEVATKAISNFWGRMDALRECAQGALDAPLKKVGKSWQPDKPLEIPSDARWAVTGRTPEEATANLNTTASLPKREDLRLVLVSLNGVKKFY